MGFWRDCYNNIDASNPTERNFTFVIGIFLMFLMILAVVDVIGGGLYIALLLCGVIT